MKKILIFFLLFFGELGHAQNILGIWEIHSFHFGWYPQMSDNEAKKYIGSKVLLEGTKVSGLQGSCLSKSVIYDSRRAKTNEYLDSKHIVGRTLGIDKNEIDIIEVRCSRSEKEPSFEFMLVDENTLITEYRGYFFTMKKIN